MKLTELRNEINEIDKDMLNLFLFFKTHGSIKKDWVI